MKTRIVNGPLAFQYIFKDTECRYLFATHYWNHIEHDVSEEWSIRGKTDLEIRKDKENAALAYEQNKKILSCSVWEETDF